MSPRWSRAGPECTDLAPRELMKGAIAVGLAAMAALVLGLAALAGAATGTSVTTAAAVEAELSLSCTVMGPVPGLDAAQAANAEAIVTATFAVAAESQRAAQIATANVAVT